jgi:hypothetical protein
MLECKLVVELVSKIELLFFVKQQLELNFKQPKTVSKEIAEPKWAPKFFRLNPVQDEHPC